MSAKVAEVMVQSLLLAGARRCYGIVGDTINRFTDAVHASELEWVSVRHEEVGAFAAGGEAYMTGELAVCAGTCGPGSLHFLNGIFESHRNGAPVLLIASNVPRAEEGFQFPQEVDQTKLYENTSVFCARLSDPQQARRLTMAAAQAALAKRGVAVIVVNGDMFEETVSDPGEWAVHRPQPVVAPSTDELRQLASMLNDADKITIYAGYGAREARGAIVKLATALNAPVVHTTRAKEFIEPDNPFNVGMTGILGNLAGMEAVAHCDVLLCLGTDFAYTQFYPEKAKIVQIDADATHLGRRAPISMGLVGDIHATAEALLALVDEKADRSHLDRVQKRWRKDQEEYTSSAKESDERLIHPQYVAQTLDQAAADDAIFTADGGTAMVWMHRHLRANGSRRFLASMLHGTMANAYPQAIGIAKAYPQRQVIAMCGDGGVTMLLGDLLTLVEQKLPVKLLVFNNGALGFVEMEQRVEGLLDAYTSLSNPDFSKLAQVCGMQGFRVEQASRLEEQMKDWLDAPGPALLDVKVNRMEMVMPPKIEAGQVAGGALFGLKAILHGRGTELVSLLRDNLLR